jgi:uncharacterized membrane protein
MSCPYSGSSGESSSFVDTISNAIGNLTSCKLEDGSSGCNVGATERMISLVGGSAITLYGLRRGGFSGLVIAAIGGSLAYRGFTGHCEMYRSLGISTNQPEGQLGVPAQYGVKYEKNFIINRPATELYNYWRDLNNLPRIMRHLKCVTQLGEYSHWVAEGPLGMQVEWDAEIMNEEPGRLIAWQSLPGGQVDTAGSVHFDELSPERGTQVRVSLKYNPPGGKVGAGIASLLGSSVEQEIEEDMRRFKQVMEAGEIATTRGQPSARF